MSIGLTQSRLETLVTEVADLVIGETARVGLESSVPGGARLQLSSTRRLVSSLVGLATVWMLGLPLGPGGGCNRVSGAGGGGGSNAGSAGLGGTGGGGPGGKAPTGGTSSTSDRGDIATIRSTGGGGGGAAVYGSSPSIYEDGAKGEYGCIVLKYPNAYDISIDAYGHGLGTGPNSPASGIVKNHPDGVHKVATFISGSPQIFSWIKSASVSAKEI